MKNINNEWFNNAAAACENAGLDLIKAQAASGAPREWNVKRTAAVQAAAVGYAFELVRREDKIIYTAPDGKEVEVDPSKVFLRVVSMALASWLGQTSTQQKKAEKEGLYAPSAKGSKAESLAKDISSELGV